MTEFLVGDGEVVFHAVFVGTGLGVEEMQADDRLMNDSWVCNAASLAIASEAM